MDIQLVDKATLANWVRDTLTENPPPDAFWLPLLFAGDRLRAADDAFVARTGEKIVGAVTLSARGEMGEGPEIIGLYVLPSYRRRGLGTRLLLQAYNTLKGRGANRVRVVVLSPAARELLRKLEALDLDIVDALSG